MAESEERLDALVNNAGALLPERRVSVDGYEMTFATMVLGPFVLTNGLVPLLERTAGHAGVARVVNVASGGMYLQGLHLDDLQMEREPYRGSIAYARAKRALVTLTREWSRRLRGRAITVNAMHPGWADTPGVVASLPTFHRLIGPRLRTPEEGADTIVWLVASEEPARTDRQVLAGPWSPPGRPTPRHPRGRPGCAPAVARVRAAEHVGERGRPEPSHQRVRASAVEESSDPYPGRYVPGPSANLCRTYAHGA